MKSLTFICLVRHGETDWNFIGKIQGRTDIPLNNIGVKQAEECCNALKGSSWDVLITSPLKRAKQTAEIINIEINIPLKEMGEFVERSYGDAEGMLPTERMTKYPDTNYPNQEDRQSLNKRVMDGLKKINQIYKGKKVLLVAHGAVINTILAHLSNGEIGSGKTKLVNACISNIEKVEEDWKIRDYNQIGNVSQYNTEVRI